ncbi:hypothetical protein LINGRAHAP2_LOCUS20675 [Linum grandiflorum]
MGSNGSLTISTAASPKGGSDCGGGHRSGTVAGGGGQCLCSPTTHKGSFRCRFHGASSSALSKKIMNRSYSMPTANNSSSVIAPDSTSSSLACISPKSVEST